MLDLVRAWILLPFFKDWCNVCLAPILRDNTITQWLLKDDSKRRSNHSHCLVHKASFLIASTFTSYAQSLSSVTWTRSNYLNLLFLSSSDWLVPILRVLWVLHFSLFHSPFISHSPFAFFLRLVVRWVKLHRVKLTPLICIWILVMGYRWKR